MMSYPAFPTLTSRAADESPRQYGHRALCFVLDTGITASVDDEGLQQADQVSLIATSAADISPSALERLQMARHQIAASLRFRVAERAKAVPAALMNAQPPTTGGRRAPVRRPVPALPPTGSARPF